MTGQLNLLDSPDKRYVPSPARSSKNRNLIILLMALGAVLVLTNRWFPAVDDECAIIDRAAQPISYTIELYLTGKGEHEHPPLYDLILHEWLRLTSGNMYLLRVPAITFYLLGIWALAVAAKLLAGERAQVWALVLMILWPFGFHFGRVAAWYSFSFMLVSALTWVYFVYLEQPTLAIWSWVVFLSLLLVYTNYFGWVLLGFLAFDLVVRDPRDFRKHSKRLVAGGCLLVLACTPIFAASFGEIQRRVHLPHSSIGALLTGIYNLYCTFVSESVAPWFWIPGVLAGTFILIVLAVTLWQGPRLVTRFLIYFIGLFTLMTLIGIVETKRVLFITPWLMLPLAVTLGALPPARWARRVCLLSLACLAAIGWYGIFVRTLYAAPHWVEPWDRVADEAASVIRAGGIVIGNNPSFFFYLTYSLRDARPTVERASFPGLLPTSLRYPGVFNPSQWLVEGRALAPKVLVVEGAHYGNPEGPTIETKHLLEEACTLTNTEKIVHDPGVPLKRRFIPAIPQPEWRVMLSLYACPRGK